MAITNTDEFLAYSSFNDTGGVTTSDTFNTWRKKTNGIINAIDVGIVIIYCCCWYYIYCCCWY